jgi:hypothetical protein
MLQVYYLILITIRYNVHRVDPDGQSSNALSTSVEPRHVLNIYVIRSIIGL